MSDGRVLLPMQRKDKSRIPVQNIKPSATSRNALTDKTQSSEPEKMTVGFRSVGADALTNGH